ncbi:hypothetical protein ABIE89_002654 [Bradyrhizobium niftali]
MSLRSNDTAIDEIVASCNGDLRGNYAHIHSPSFPVEVLRRLGRNCRVPRS